MSNENCAHFNGFQNETCEAGIRYLDLVDNDSRGMALRLPCSAVLRAEQTKLSKVECPHFRAKTTAEIAKENDDINRAVLRMQKIFPWVIEMKKKYHSGAHEGACPICSGVIRFSIASSNRHMRAQCATEDCVSFIE